MSKKYIFANVVFFLGLLVFAVAFIISIVNPDLYSLLVNGIMAIGLIIEFIGLVLTYKFDSSVSSKDTKTREEKALEQEKKTSVEEKVENVVEADVEELEEEKPVEKPAPKKTTTTKKAPAKKTTTKKGTTTKKKTTTKKTTTKKSTTKKKSSTKKGK